MKKRNIIFALVLVILSSLIVSSHGDSEENVQSSSDLYPLSSWAAVGYGSLAFGLVIVYILLFNNKMSEIQKKAVFYILVLICMLVTIYLVVTTIHLNLISESKGPVHWHADYEIWVCDKEVELYEPKGMSNMQGDGAFHSHNDNRLHVEGVIVDMKSARLSAFFDAIGGSMSDDGMEIPTDDGIVKIHDGDMCNNQPGKLYVFVNGNLTEHADDYVISPYEQVPPGDRIKFIFTEKPIEQINPSLK